MDSLKAYRHLDDLSLTKKVIIGDDIAFEVLSARYLNLIYSTAYKYSKYLYDYDINDLVQEGLITMHFVCNHYSEDKNASFKNFLILCIENRYKNLLKTAQNKKAVPKDMLVPLTQQVENISDINALDMSEVLETKEYVKGLINQFKGRLSDMEFTVISLYLSSMTYREIAKELSISEKSVDNAMQRIRRKLSDSKNS